MALRTIVQDGDPILKKVCRPVTKFDEKLGILLDDMKETLLATNDLNLTSRQRPGAGGPPGGHDAPPVHLPG